MRKPESLQPGITELQNVSFGPSLPHSSFQDILQTSICTVFTSTAVVSGNPGSFLPGAGPLQFPFTSCPKTVPAGTPVQQLCPLYLLLGFLLPAERSCVGWEGVLRQQCSLCRLDLHHPQWIHLPRNESLLHSPRLQHLNLIKSLFSLTASNHQLASLLRENFYPFC